MRIVIAGLIAVVACGGSDFVGYKPPSVKPPPPPPAGVKLVNPGVYTQATIKRAAAGGDALPMTLIADATGVVYLYLPGYGVVRGAMGVNGDGTLWQGVGNLVVQPDGTVVDANIVGTSDGTTLAGTVNGHAFGVSLTSIAAQPTDLSAQGGDYYTTWSSGSQWLSLALTWVPGDKDLSALGHAYATEADAQANDPSKATWICVGTFSATNGTGNVTANPNVFNSGYALHDGAGRSVPATYGFAFFTADGLVSITANPSTGDSMAATFARR